MSNIDLANASFKLMVEDKFLIERRNLIVVTGRVSVGQISTDDEVIITDKKGIVKGRSKIIVEYLCSSKMSEERRNVVYEGTNIAIMLKDVLLDEIEINDYLVAV